MTGRRDVVTLYFCGSNNNRRMANLVLPHLYDNTVGDDRKVIFDGPGGGAIAHTEKILEMAESGRDAPLGRKVFKPKSWFKSKSQARSESWDRMLAGSAGSGGTGKGTQNTIVMALQWLWLRWYKERFIDINLAGFSRGAVSCIMLAHAIQEAGFANLGLIRVNIFAFDPVPGGLNDFGTKEDIFDQTGRVGTPHTLPSCVASYASVLQENIRKWQTYKVGGLPITIAKDRNFKCVIPVYTGTNRNRTAQQLYPMPGVHSASVEYGSPSGEGRIGAYLCQSFLEAHGTEITAGFSAITPTELLEDYAKVRGHYSENGDISVKQATSYHRNYLVNNPFRTHPFYINAHHYLLMAESFPDLADHIDGSPLPLGRVRSGILQFTLPKTMHLLSRLGYLSAETEAMGLA